MRVCFFGLVSGPENSTAQTSELMILVSCYQGELRHAHNFSTAHQTALDPDIEAEDQQISILIQGVLS